MFFCSEEAPETALCRFAQQIQVIQRQISQQFYQMWVVPLEGVLDMTTLKTHEELQQDGILVPFNPKDGSAIFVSHQWAGVEHPDPHFEQFKVLQESLKNVLCGASTFHSNLSMELYMMPSEPISAKDLLARPLFIWYDYFSCPQCTSSSNDRDLAINSIPAFIEQCSFFVILCPNIRHIEKEELLNKSTWKKRGWCRLERACWEVSTHDSSRTLQISSATSLSVGATFDWVQAPVGEGEFTVESDRQRISQVLSGLVNHKLHIHLERGDLHQYRLLLNLQRVQFRHLAEPNRSFLPDFAKEEEADDDLCGVANFLYQNGFRCITERSDAGWTPICFAALDGEPRLMLKLIESHADVNASLTKPEPLLGFGVGTCCLSIAAYVKNNEALQLLISHRADLNHVDSFSATVAHWAAVGGNTEGLRILRDAGASFEGANVLGYSPFRMACSGGHVEAMKMLLAHTPLLEVDLGVHTAILHEGGYAEVLAVLLEENVDVDHQLSTSIFTGLGALLAGYSLIHRYKETTLSTYAYHHQQATPLMCSLLTGAYEATAMLMAAGARTELRNGRGKSALDLALETGAPGFILCALRGDCDACERLLSGYIEVAARHVLSTERV